MLTAYPNGGGHFWVYLQWARTAGAWLPGNLARADRSAEPLEETNQNVATLQEHLARLADSLALTTPMGTARPRKVATRSLDLKAAAEADLLLNVWHSLPAPVVQRFRRSALMEEAYRPKNFPI